MKAVLFDFDGVLTLEAKGYYTTALALAKRTGMDTKKISVCHYAHTKNFYTQPLHFASILGKMSRCLGKTITLDLLYDAFKATLLNPAMMKLVVELKQNYNVGIITDNPKERMNVIRRKYAFDTLFDTIIVSSEVGVMKTEEKIFTAALDALHLKAEDCLFIDNSQKNLVVPANMGMATLWFNFAKKEEMVQLIRSRT